MSRPTEPRLYETISMSAVSWSPEEGKDAHPSRTWLEMYIRESDSVRTFTHIYSQTHRYQTHRAIQSFHNGCRSNFIFLLDRKKRKRKNEARKKRARLQRASQKIPKKERMSVEIITWLMSRSNRKTRHEHLKSC